MTVRITIISLLLFVMAISCGESQDSPRNTVIHLFGAMERNDRAAVNDLLDLPSLMQEGPQDWAAQAPRLSVGAPRANRRVE